MFFGYLLVPQIIFQVLCILHVVRHGKERMWIYIILFLPFFGGIAYLISEILPGLRSGRLLEDTNRQVGHALFPSRKIQALEEQTELADTYQNRMQLAEAYAASGRFEEAITLFTKTLQGIYQDDSFALGKRALAYYASGNMVLAKKDFDHIIETKGILEEKEQLIYALTLEAMEENSKAEAAYKNAIRVATGLEAEYSYVLFLKKSERHDEAKELLQYMIRKAKSSPSYFRRREAKWLKFAKEALNEYDQAGK